MKFSVVIKAFILLLLLQASFKAFAAPVEHFGYVSAWIARANHGTIIFNLDTDASNTCAANGGIWGQFEVDATTPLNDRLIQAIQYSFATKQRVRVQFDNDSCGTEQAPKSRIQTVYYVQLY